MRVALVLATAAILAGCQTSMSTRPIAPREFSDRAPAALIGTPYTLPALRYEIAIVRTLTKCEPVAGGRDLDVEFDVSVEAKPTYVAGERFVIDYRALSSWSKTTSFKMETYDNHTLKSFNAEASDEGPEIAAGLIKTGFTIARMVSGLAPVAASPGFIESTPRKSPKVKGVCPDAVGHIEALTDGLKAPTKQLTDKSKELDRLSVAQFVGTLSEEDKKRVTKLRDDIQDLSDKTAAMQKKIDGWRSEVTFTENIVLDPRWGTAKEVVSFPSDDPVTRPAELAWLKRMFGKDSDAQTMAEVGGWIGFLVATVAPTTPALDPVDCPSLGASTACAPSRTPNWAPWKGDDTYRAYVPASAAPVAVPGVVFRDPVSTRLRICRQGLETPADAQLPVRVMTPKEATVECARGALKALVQSDAAAPQLGRTFVLPLTNGFGQNNKLHAAFRQDGSLDWASYDGKGVGTRFADLLGGAADDAAGYAAAERADRKAAAEAAANAEATALDSQIALAKKRKDLADAEAALDSKSAAAKQAQAELDAQVARLEAQKKIKDLEAALNP